MPTPVQPQNHLQQPQRAKRMTTTVKKGAVAIGLQDREVTSKAKAQRKRAAAYV